MDMKEYEHNTSKVIEQIEALFTTEDQKKYDIPILHSVYEENRYRFFDAKTFYGMMSYESYRFDGIADVLSEELFTIWYNEMLRINPPTIVPGTPVTIFYYTDRRAATVTKVDYYANGKHDAAGNLIPKTIYAQHNEVICNDYYAGDYTVIPLENPENQTWRHSFRLRKGGRWIETGSTFRDGLRCGVGFWHHYIDPCF
jgi:hypothetical protein